MHKQSVAYFSMEIALEPGMPTYGGGLGVLAGDTIRAAADFKVPMVAVSLVHRKGYFFQRIDSSGWQHEEPVRWNLDDFLQEMPARASVTVEGRDAASLYEKLEGHVVPTFYDNRPRFIEMMRHAIALNGSFFNTQRMLSQYVLKAYFA